MIKPLEVEDKNLLILLRFDNNCLHRILGHELPTSLPAVEKLSKFSRIKYILRSGNKFGNIREKAIFCLQKKKKKKKLHCSMFQLRFGMTFNTCHFFRLCKFLPSLERGISIETSQVNVMP